MKPQLSILFLLMLVAPAWAMLLEEVKSEKQKHSSDEATDMVADESFQALDSVRCAICHKPIKKDGKCMQILRAMTCSPQLTACSNPHCVAVCHRYCLDNWIEKNYALECDCRYCNEGTFKIPCVSCCSPVRNVIMVGVMMGLVVLTVGSIVGLYELDQSYQKSPLCPDVCNSSLGNETIDMICRLIRH